MRSPVLAFTLTLVTLAWSAPADAAKLLMLNQDSPGQGLNDPTAATPLGNNPGTTVGAQRRNVYQFAMGLWGATLQSNVAVKIGASFAPLSCNATSGVLGSAGPYWIFNNFPNAPLANTWYHSALADAIGNMDFAADLDPNDPYDIVSQFNSNLGTTGCLEGSGWYYGVDGATPAGKINFLDVVMHEIGHGLGVSGFLDKSTGALYSGLSDVYTHNAYDNALNLRFDDPGMTNATRAEAMRTPGRLVWIGTQVNTEGALYLDPFRVLSVTAPAGIAGSYLFGGASFGPPADGSNFSGQLILANDGVGTLTDGCEAFAGGFFSGKFALIDRGTCTFVIKVKNAQNAGALGVVIADNVAGSPPPELGGSDPTITIPAVRVTLAAGNTFKANLPVTLGGIVDDPVLLSGADAAGRVQLYAPTVVAAGSTFSHFDITLSPNALMEPAINDDLDGNFRVDLTQPMFRDLGWVQPAGNAKIKTCNTGVPLVLTGGIIPGANVQSADNLCLRTASPSRLNAAYKACMNGLADKLLASGSITPSQDTSLRACIN